MLLPQPMQDAHGLERLKAVGWHLHMPFLWEVHQFQVTFWYIASNLPISYTKLFRSDFIHREKFSSGVWPLCLIYQKLYWYHGLLPIFLFWLIKLSLYLLISWCIFLSVAFAITKVTESHNNTDNYNFKISFFETGDREEKKKILWIVQSLLISLLSSFSYKAKSRQATL